MRYALLAIVPMILATAFPVEAEDSLSTLRQIELLLEDGTVAVVRLQVSRLSQNELSQLIPDAAVHSPDQREAVLNYANRFRERVTQFGVTDAYGIVSSADLGQFGPYWLIPATDEAAARRLAGFLSTGNPETDEAPEAATNGLPLRVTRRGDVVFYGHAAAFARLGRTECPARPNLRVALKAAGDSPISAAVAPTDQQRRVLREFLPEFPSESGTLAPESAAAIEWLALGLDPATQQLHLVGESSDDLAAARIAAWAPGFLTWLSRQSRVGSSADAITVTPEPLSKDFVIATGKRIESHFPRNQPVLIGLLDRLFQGVFLTSESIDTVRSLKQLGLAMHMFHEAWKSFPPPASYSKEGRPLLSWRIFLLPYLDQGELYSKFHLDEPWDSPHNKTLIRQMPPVFSSETLDLNLAGKTTFLVPVGEGTVFHGREGVPIHAITDGTSNTFMVIQAAPEQAVIWTKPEDLTVDFQHLDRLFPASMSTFRATLCDGSAWSNLNPRMPAETLKRLLQRADGEQIDTNSARK